MPGPEGSKRIAVARGLTVILTSGLALAAAGLGFGRALA